MDRSAQPSIHISVAEQRLELRRGRTIERSFPISTSKFGLGSEEGSLKTPLGLFRIVEKVGDGLPLHTVFKNRKPVRPSATTLKSDDLVMSRILRIDGLETHNLNSIDRFIYIHGTNHEDAIGAPASHGCIRMKMSDVAELFDLVEVGTQVIIAAPKPRRTWRGDGDATPRRTSSFGTTERKDTQWSSQPSW